MLQTIFKDSTSYVILSGVELLLRLTAIYRWQPMQKRKVCWGKPQRDLQTVTVTFSKINVTFMRKSLLRLKGDPFLAARSLLRCAQSVLAQLVSLLRQNFDASR